MQLCRQREPVQACFRRLVVALDSFLPVRPGGWAHTGLVCGLSLLISHCRLCESFLLALRIFQILNRFKSIGYRYQCYMIRPLRV